MKINLYNQGLSTKISVVDESTSFSTTSLKAGFEINGYSICNMKAKASMLPNGKLVIIGDMPVIAENAERDLEFSNETLVTEYLKEQLASEGFPQKYTRLSLKNVFGTTMKTS